MEKKTLSQSLIGFRDKIETVKKDADNPFFKSKYADLPSILEAIRKPLSECKLCITHKTEYHEDNLILKTTLTAEDGNFIESFFPVFGSKPQEVGSSMTYARRYNLQALLDIPTDDDDGNAGNSAKPIKKTTTTTAGAVSTDKPWYNSFEKEKGLIEDAILRGDVTPQGAIDRLEEKYKVNSIIKSEILKLKAN